MPFIAPLVGNKPQLNLLGEPVRYRDSLYHRLWTGQGSDPVWEFLDTRHLKISPIGNQKLAGQQMDEDQKYDFTAFRGEHLRSLLTDQLPTLRAVQNDQQLTNRFKVLEKRASDMAKHDMISGKKPTFPPSSRLRELFGQQQPAMVPVGP